MIVLDRYQIRRIIGAGGTGIVLQGKDDELNRVVAIKVLSPLLAAHGLLADALLEKGKLSRQSFMKMLSPSTMLKRAVPSLFS